MRLHFRLFVVFFLAIILISSNLEARGSGGGSKSSGRSSSGGKSASRNTTSDKNSSKSKRTKNSDVAVDGYMKKDGTYVAPHMRSGADATKQNNFSTKGNINPYTGQPGTKDP